MNLLHICVLVFHKSFTVLSFCNFRSQFILKWSCDFFAKSVIILIHLQSQKNLSRRESSSLSNLSKTSRHRSFSRFSFHFKIHLKIHFKTHFKSRSKNRSKNQSKNQSYLFSLSNQAVDQTINQVNQKVDQKSIHFAFKCQLFCLFKNIERWWNRRWFVNWWWSQNFN
jgi:hypothetical protein